MARTYHLGRARRLVNAVMSPLARVGLGGRHTYNLTVCGRRTGRPYTVPVILVEDSERWLVAPYGEVAWVRNARAAGTVKLSRAGSSETVQIQEVTPERAAPILKQYLRSVPVVRPFFDVTPRSQLAAFVAEAPRHPVFLLTARSDVDVTKESAGETTEKERDAGV